MITISPTGTYRELSELVDDAGLMAPRPDYYAWKIASNLLLTAAVWTTFFLVGDSWWQVLVAVALGLSFVQSGFLGHDVGHQQVSRRRGPRYVLGLIHLNLLIGASYGWWVGHHNRHHSDPNNLDRDPDTVRRQVIFDPSELPVKARTPFRRFVIRYQSVMFFVLLAQESWRVHMAGFQTARAGALRRPWLELGLVLVHAAAYLTAVSLVLSFWQAVVFVLVSQTVFGFYLGAVFAPNHKGMPVYRSTTSLDWLHRQVLTSRNIRPGWFTDFAFGGLNYQIEHHLFPSMARANLRSVRPIVRRYCDEHGIPYCEVGVLASYREVARYLGEVSEAARS
ncbi:fatty acid desaturase family protein [Actinophytocola sp. NPDC049390]|uniref:fatty acid desaturase family protein n=1 Tax=Actinophytocola sp. NPDC049390 TaxID=3363894 RepID=UPI00379FF276